MSEYCLIKKDTLTSIGDSIRAKTGGTDPINPTDMPASIDRLKHISSDVYTDFATGQITTLEISGDKGDNVVDYFCYKNEILTDLRITGINDIGNYAFYENTNLTSVYIVASTEANARGSNILERCFSGCINLSKVDMDINNIEASAFEDCEKITGHIMCRGYISDRAFLGCTKIEMVEMGGEHLGSSSFFSCMALRNIVAPNITTIYEYCFYNCSSLWKIDAPLVEIINNNAFNGCTLLNQIDLSNVIRIYDYAFYYCNSFRIIDLPKATHIGDCAFSNCSNLKAILLRSDTPCNIALSSVLGTKIATLDGMPTGEGFVYVPTSLYDLYTGVIDSNLGITGAGAMFLRKLEDYTVDGTTTGALDESKI